jgi:hypothetical protein
MELILKIAVGVFIGSLAAIFAWEGIHVVAVEYALVKANDAVKQSIRDQRKRDAAMAQQRADEEAAQRARDAEAERAVATAGLERERARAAKDAAWKKFYQPSPGCQADRSTMECANAYMRAKTQFEGTYRE